MSTEITQRVVVVQIDSNTRINPVNTIGEYLRVGSACNPAYGGGVIASMEFSKAKGAIIVRKDKKFRDPADAKLGEFDCVMIPMSKVVCAYACDEVVPQQQPQQQQVKGK